MAIPKYDAMYKALLVCLRDMQQHRKREVLDKIAADFSVTAEERQLLLPSGRQRLFDNRVGWTITYLKKAGLVISPRRGIYQLTEEGKKVVEADPPVVDNTYLERYDSFKQFVSAQVTSGNGQQPQSVTGADDLNGKTPQDALDAAYQQINQALADDILSEIMRQQPGFFERLVVQLLEHMGYGGSVEHAGQVIGKSGDEGIDGIIREDKLGFSMIYIQAKRWDRSTSIGRPEIQKFVGALAGQGASKGLFVTTAQFTKEAREYAKKQHTTKVVLVDGDALAKLMIEYNVGVSTQAVYQIKQLDSDFFGEENG